MTPFSPLPVAAASMVAGQLYLWHIPNCRHTLVRLNALGDGIDTPEEDDSWFFDNHLKGALYGPIVLAEPCYICGSLPNHPTETKLFCSRCGNQP